MACLPLSFPFLSQLYLHQLLEAGGSQPPPGVLRVLRSKACRSAVMFGDALDATQCCDLVQRLAGTELCFVCAHGRCVRVGQGWGHRLGCHHTAGWLVECRLVCLLASLHAPGPQALLNMKP
jgi:hypothetical protein